MSLTRTTLAAAALLAALAGASPARAACTAADVSCVGATACTITGTVTVIPPTANAVCVFDFGAKDVTIVSGGFVGGSNAYEIRAHSLTLATNARLTATGGNSNKGGIVTLTLGAGGFALNSTATGIDVTGAPGGTFLVQSDGNVSLQAPIQADARSATTTAGNVFVTAGRQGANGSVAASGSITLGGARGEGITAAVLGQTSTASGGVVTLTAIGAPGSGNIAVNNQIDVTGGSVGGGTITLTSAGNTSLGPSPNSKLFIADAFGSGVITPTSGGAGQGGTISILAGGKVDGSILGAITASGHTALAAGTDGGDGGEVDVEALNGTVVLGGIAGTLQADAGSGGFGGSVSVSNDAPPGAAMSLGVPTTALGPGTSSDVVGANSLAGEGGTISIDGRGAVTITRTVDASGGAGGGGDIDINADGALAVNATVAADATADAGCIMLSSGGGMTVTGPLSAQSTVNTLTSGAGGDIMLASNGAMTLTSSIDVTASGPNAGGCADLEAEGNLNFGASASIDASGQTTGLLPGDVSTGGAVFLIAGNDERSGDLTVGGTVVAAGRANATTLNAAATIEGCTVHFASTANVDTSGDQNAQNVVTARKQVIVDAGAKITTTGNGFPTSRNTVNLPTGAAAPPSGAFSPALVPGDVHFLPLCTPAPPGACLMPCPTCGNGSVEFPETCDAPTACCDSGCRLVNCEDFDPCTADSCSTVAGGCVHTPIAGCTTTTTTLFATTTTFPVTTTTTPPPVTTTTLAVTTTVPATTVTTTTVTTTTAPTTTVTTTTVPTTTVTTTTAPTTTVTTTTVPTTTVTTTTAPTTTVTTTTVPTTTVTTTTVPTTTVTTTTVTVTTITTSTAPPATTTTTTSSTVTTSTAPSTTVTTSTVTTTTEPAVTTTTAPSGTTTTSTAPPATTTTSTTPPPTTTTSTAPPPTTTTSRVPPPTTTTSTAPASTTTTSTEPVTTTTSSSTTTTVLATSTTSTSTTTTSTIGTLPPTTTSTAPVSTTTTTAPPSCTPGDPSACDDRNVCTSDICTSDGRCLHGPALGLDAALCASFKITALVASLQPSSVGGSASQSFLLQEMVRFRKAIDGAKTHKPGRAAQNLLRARQILNVFTRIVRRAQKTGKIAPPGVAEQILDLSGNAGSALPLRARR